MVSQNTGSLQKAWIATLFSFSKGMMVGDSDPGRSLHNWEIFFESVFSITYLQSKALITPLILSISFKIILSFDRVRFFWVINTACDFKTVLNSTRLLASNVAPDETKSQI